MFRAKIADRVVSPTKLKAKPMTIKPFLRRLRSEVSGNVLIIFGFAIVPMTFATAMGVDYAHAARLQTKMNSLADAAALAAVTQTMMSESDATAESTARAMFNAQAAELEGVTYNPADLKVTLSHPNGNGSRNAVVSYTALAKNSFSGVLGSPTIEIGGSSTAKNLVAPNIDFYLALDTSSSMALPTTTAGFTTMDNAVKCAFACHSNKIEQYVGTSIPSLILDNTKFALIKGTYSVVGSGTSAKQPLDDKGAYIYVSKAATDSKCKAPSSNLDICVYNSDGTYADSYWYAQNQGVQLRVTAERNAAKDLMSLAQSYSAANHRQYRAALYTFDHSTGFKTISDLTTDLPSVSTAANAVDLVTVNDKQANGCPMTGCTNNNKYLFTSFKTVLTQMGSTLPAMSGQGTDAKNDTPQAFLFMVTDGMSDEDIGSGRTRKAMQQDQINQCTAIKNRGIRIAILYTEYTVDSIKDDEPNQRALATAAIPDIAPQLTKCASPGLMYTVKTDQSISEALKALFSIAVDTARITQ